MFREMRRQKQKLPEEECRSILYQGSAGTLALSGDDGYPYAVPISYVYDGEKLYFHSAKSGHKLDAIGRNPKASFCVIDRDHVVPEEYTTYFRSVIVFGTIAVLEDEREKWDAVQKLALKYAPDDTEENRNAAIDRSWTSLCILELTPEYISGKEGRELARQREQNRP